MAIAVSHPAERNPFDIEKEREDLLNFFQKSGVMPTSLFHQTWWAHFIETSRKIFTVEKLRSSSTYFMRACFFS